MHNSSIHVGIRAPLIRPKGDIRNDIRCGFDIITARDFDKIGASGIIEKIKERVGSTNVYISIDIDVLDPAFAPGMWSIDLFLFCSFLTVVLQQLERQSLAVFPLANCSPFSMV